MNYKKLKKMIALKILKRDKTRTKMALKYINSTFFKELHTHPTKWTDDDVSNIVNKLTNIGCMQIKHRKEYVLLKEVVKTNSAANNVNNTENTNFGKVKNIKNPLVTTSGDNGVISPYGEAKDVFDTSMCTSSRSNKAFLKPLDIQKSESISKTIPSFEVIQSDQLCLNIGFDTEFQNVSEDLRWLLSIQASVDLGSCFVRYFFLINPMYQDVTESGGLVPLKYCIADILNDLRFCYFPDFPLVAKSELKYRTYETKGKKPIKYVDYRAMKNSVIPVSIICHSGKADMTVFRRSKYDIDFMRCYGEIQGGLMTTESVEFKIESDQYYNYYYLINLKVRDTCGLTPADHKSLRALGNVIKRPKIDLCGGAISNMTCLGRFSPIVYYKYAMNDSDIVIDFCSELFLRNHAIPMTLSSAAARAMKLSIMDYFNVSDKSDFDFIYRGLELLDDGLVSPNGSLKFLKATRYVPLLSNPDAKLINEFFSEAYTGGFNASFYIGWIDEFTTDFDLKNAYPTAMAAVLDIDWTKHVKDFERGHVLRFDDLPNPLIPAVAVGDFDFPDDCDCYCPNIPVPVKGGMKVYPKHGRNVYMCGPDMYLAMKLGGRITIHRGFTCEILTRNGESSKCLCTAVKTLVKDRAKAKITYRDFDLIEKCLKTMVNSCYGKVAQNVSPKTRYSARALGRVDSEPSAVTSPYHAAYITAFVRCMLIACINQLVCIGYKVYSVTTDGFITNAPVDVVRHLDACGFAEIFQESRYALNDCRDDIPDNRVWEPKHTNDALLNITTRGNVAINPGGVLAHNSYTTGEMKDSSADRDKFITDVLTRTGRLECSSIVWSHFSDIVEKKHGFNVTKLERHLSMNFDYKRCPVTDTAVDVNVHYERINGNGSVDATIANFDTRPFNDVEEFLNYRKVMENEDCVKVCADIKRVQVKATSEIKNCYIGKDLNRSILISILRGYRAGVYKIPALDGLKQSEAVYVINSWNISPITVNDWKNCSRSKRQSNLLPRDIVDDMLNKILEISIK